MEEVKTETQDTIENPEELSGDALKQYLAEQTAKEFEDTAEPEVKTEENAENQVEVPEGAEETQETAEAEPGASEESEVDKLRRQVEEKEKFAQRQANELGELRRRQLELEQQLQQDLNPDDVQQRMLEDPNKTLAEIQQHQRQRMEYESRTAELQRLQTEQTVKQFYPEFDGMVSDIAELARKDGATEEQIRAFQSNPYNENIALLINMAKRVEASREMTTLKAELEKERKKSQNVGQRIDEAARSKPGLTNATGKGGQAKGTVELSEAEIDNLSGDSLKKVLRERLEAEQAELGG